MRHFSVGPALTVKGREFHGLRGGFNVETAGDSPVWHPSEGDGLPGQKPAEPAAGSGPASTAAVQVGS